MLKERLARNSALRNANYCPERSGLVWGHSPLYLWVVIPSSGLRVTRGVWRDPSSQVQSEQLRGLLIQSETRARATQTFLIRLLHQLSHLCRFPLVIGSKSHAVRRASVHTFAEGDQQGKEGACATWQPDFSDRDK